MTCQMTSTLNEAAQFCNYLKLNANSNKVMETVNRCIKTQEIITQGLLFVAIF